MNQNIWQGAGYTLATVQIVFVQQFQSQPK